MDKIDKNTIESVCLHYDTLFVITRSKTENTLLIFAPTSEKIETLKVGRCKSVIIIDDLIYLSSDEELKVYNKRLQLLNVILLPKKMNNFLFTFSEIKSKKDIYGIILYITNGKTTYVLGKNNKSKYYILEPLIILDGRSVKYILPFHIHEKILYVKNKKFKLVSSN